MTKTRLLAGLGLSGLLAIIGNDARYHFDKPLVALKQQHQSPQHNWSVYYSQDYVFYNSPFRYLDEFKKIKQIIEPDSVLLSDLPSSYYAAATLPVYVKNIHRHHGRYRSNNWLFLDKQHHCYIDLQENLKIIQELIKKERKAKPAFRYILLNKDGQNKLLHRYCFSARSSKLEPVLQVLGDLVVEGKFLNLYKIR